MDHAAVLCDFVRGQVGSILFTSMEREFRELVAEILERVEFSTRAAENYRRGRALMQESERVSSARLAVCVERPEWATDGHLCLAILLSPTCEDPWEVLRLALADKLEGAP